MAFYEVPEDIPEDEMPFTGWADNAGRVTLELNRNGR